VPVLLAAIPADADDVRGRAAVLDVAEDGVGEVRTLDEVAEGLGELGPVRDQRRDVDRPPLGEADERRDRGADAFDRPGPGLDFLDVNTWRQVRRHDSSFEGQW
jgi:hypothetical protein